MLCQQKLISPHKYLVIAQQNMLYQQKKLTSQRNERIHQKYAVSSIGLGLGLGLVVT